MLIRHSFVRSLFGFLCMLTLVAGCARDIPVYTPPDQRPVQAAEQPWPSGQFLALAYHDIEDSDPDQTFVAVRTDHFVQQMAWLHENGYQPVSIDQILAAKQGGKPLPAKAILLSFDDGFSSLYTRAFPILKAYGWHAVLAPEGAWIDTPTNKKEDFGGVPIDRDRMLTWAQIKEMSQSGLVEIGAHTDTLHHGALANPQGNMEPAAAIRNYIGKTHQYETEASYKARLNNDIRQITQKVRRVTGKKPRVWIWPYGESSGTALTIVGAHGYSIALTLDDGMDTVDRLMSSPRYLVTPDPSVTDYASAVIARQASPIMRVAHVDLDDVYDPDPAQMERNLGKMVQRISDMQITTVFLQAFADPVGDGLVKSVYFPNHVLPMRADLFNRAAWQLSTRAKVQVYAWMPVLSFDLSPALARVSRWDPATGKTSIDPKQYRRLSPFDPNARKQIIQLYEDLARSAIFDGILYHDDATLSDFEDAGPQALAAYRAAGLPDTIAALRSDPATLQRWTRFKSRALIDFTKTLTQHVRAIRGPQIKTARNIFAMPILDPKSETWFAQNLDDFLGTYDWTAPMAMPLMENVPTKQADAWLDRLVDTVAAHPGALKKTVFELQSRDWRPSPGKPDGVHVDSALLAHWMKRLQLRGASNFGYYPDDFIQNQPKLEIIRPAISTAWFPFK
ncbi:MAG: poly-beta-1,6-N-acetyl-D-glucosamine N-deacetylase PgaB [Candidimonas sp.]|nr:MAG: poly-beta-1,6-N-acetyl-D-glucosamine N-deacetylase PgaB [Candidimonas sp.]TAM22748.1 MAG: poly-beta-1,6-N-acetyl-D-glucosamine N-deacetylase PgaB [Candidimonas sp.]TAM74518.1 MAG: poly-beta-1,6-N-acetyl-D-glucosamine N-deacetylase PgaB [Candidimonas sp.]